MQVVLVRHAEPAASTGDPDLSTKGVTQAGMLARLLSQIAQTPTSVKILASTLKRARQTAVTIAEPFGLATSDVITFPSATNTSTGNQLAAKLIDQIRQLQLNGATTAIVVGHFDYIPHTLALSIASNTPTFAVEDFAAIAAVDFTGDVQPGAGELAWFFVPNA